MVLSLFCVMLSSAVFSSLVMVSPLATWLATAGLGLGMSALFGTSLIWTCQYVALKHWHMAATTLAMSLGNTSPAFLIAPWIETYPMVLPYVTVSLSVVLCVMFAIMLCFARGRSRLTA
ncbi:uncharacterized protein LOC100901423 [Galendromus occidentalis]|uniref:Uncharacterized protein LOC100901423 n=1 Tax=Galendromus occidentalis TaxID=34638 RepID=A0AAJ6VU40_9ACAR|nr:uncharacterized protein LOC100901423 [Galendromus occidentalis]